MTLPIVVLQKIFCLEQGMNCFYLESKDDVTIPDRTGSLFRKDVPLDFRVLNFALSQFLVTPLAHPE